MRMKTMLRIIEENLEDIRSNLKGDEWYSFVHSFLNIAHNQPNVENNIHELLRKYSYTNKLLNLGLTRSFDIDEGEEGVPIETVSNQVADINEKMRKTVKKEKGWLQWLKKRLKT
ncbi:MAG: hypothetical protein B6244_06300 [Candidatus Cloacimonetes bacterium 4572_55]|nr:MAG: hypothetical protein B6244_06300 [Candidatus Cloacimonetes bacterium 4572_55]